MTISRRRFDRSMALLARARRVVPGASQTLSKGPSMFVEGAYPVFLERGRGCRVWDVDGNEYVDYVLGLAAITLGYDYPAVSEAVARQIERGSIFSLPHPLEVEVSERLVEVIPCAEMVRFLKTGSEANAAVVRVARAATGRDVMLVCYDAETEVLTEEGFRKITGLRIGESVATLNPATGLVEYHPIERLTARPWRGNLVHFTGQRVDLMVTPGHQVYRAFKNRAGQEVYRHVLAETLLGRRTHVRMTAGASWDGPTPATITIPSARFVNPNARPDRRRGHPTKGLTIFPSRPFLRLLGYYVTEGSAQKRQRPSYEIQLRQRPGAVQDRIVATIRELGFHPTLARDRTRIVFHSKELWHALQDCGTGAEEKRLPGWVKGLGPELLDEIFQAMIDGDGTRLNGAPRKFYSTSRQLVDDLWELALKLGWSATARARRNTGFSRRTIYHVSLSRETVRDIAPQNIRRAHYEGLVYCLTVKNHLVFVRRNGKAVWSGNCGYHGWHDWCAITTPRSKGIPKDARDLVVPFQYNHLGSLEAALDEHRGRVAAVIMEPVLLEEPAPGFLAAVKAATHRHGALLIFDEIVSGFRWAVGGAQEYFGVVPDLATFGKGMASGLPLAAVVGRADLMRELEDVFVSSTFGGDTLALAACRATLDEYGNKPVIEHLWRIGRRFQDGFGAVAARAGVPAQCVGYPVHPKIVFQQEREETQRLLMSLFLQETAKGGAIFHFAGFNVSFSHTEADVDRTLEACERALRIVADALADGRVAERLEGKPYQEAFRRS